MRSLIWASEALQIQMRPARRAQLIVDQAS
jgi:hypothetical protein